MGAVASSTKGATIIAIWPAKAVADLQDGSSMVLPAVGAAGALGVPYYIFGNPLPYARNGDFVSLAAGYVIAGVVYWGVTEVGGKYYKK